MPIIEHLMHIFLMNQFKSINILINNILNWMIVYLIVFALLWLQSLCGYTVWIYLPASIISKNDMVSYSLYTDVNNYHYNIHLKFDSEEVDDMDQLAKVQKRDEKISDINRMKNKHSIFGTVKFSLRKFSEWGRFAWVEELFHDYLELEQLQLSINMRNIKQRGVHIDNEPTKSQKKEVTEAEAEAEAEQADTHPKQENKPPQNYSPQFPPVAIMHIGPNLNKNQIYNGILKSTNEVQNNEVVSIWKDGEYTRIYLGRMDPQLSKSYAQNKSTQIKSVALLVDKGVTTWSIPSQEISLHSSKLSNPIFTRHIYTFKFSLSSKSLVLPQMFFQDILAQFKLQNIQCSTKAIFKDDPKEYLVCKGLTLKQIQEMTISIKLLNKDELKLTMKSLMDTFQGGESRFFIRFADDNNLQIGQSILNTYYVGIKPKESLFYYAEKEYPSKIFTFRNKGIMILVANIIIFVLSFYLPKSKSNKMDRKTKLSDSDEEIDE